jgi:hypothetical protein
MSVLAQLFARLLKQTPARCAVVVVGDGKFQTYVASTPQQRSELERLCDGQAVNGRR